MSVELSWTPLVRSARQTPRVVLTATGTLGDVLPLVAIGVRLRAYGIDAVLAAMPEYRASAEAEGLPFHPVRPGNAEMDASGLDHGAIARAVTRDFRAGFDLMLPYIDSTVADLDAVIRDADLVIAAPLAVVARVVAERHKVPVVSVLLQPMAFRSAAEPPKMREAPFLPALRAMCGTRSVQLVYQVGTLLSRKTMRPVARLRREWGLPPMSDDVVDGIAGTEAIFAMYPASFAPLPSDAPPQAMTAGFSCYDGHRRDRSQLDPELAAFLDQCTSPIVFTLGSFVTHAPGRFYEESAAAAKRIGARAVLLVGDHAMARYAHLADADTIVVGHAQHSLIFGRASVVVHHGGIGTTAQALRAGVPQLVCPLFGDQFDNAEQLQRLGVARVIKLRNYSETAAVRALRALQSGPAIAAAGALAPAMQCANGPDIVARWVVERIGLQLDCIAAQ